jgi:hypothetical protein
MKQNHPATVPMANARNYLEDPANRPRIIGGLMGRRSPGRALVALRHERFKQLLASYRWVGPFRRGFGERTPSFQLIVRAIREVVKKKARRSKALSVKVEAGSCSARLRWPSRIAKKGKAREPPRPFLSWS